MPQTTTAANFRPTKTRIQETKVRLIREIIQDSGRPITAREISRRVLGRGEKLLHHMLPSEVAALISIHLRSEVKSDNIYRDGAALKHYLIAASK